MKEEKGFRDPDVELMLRFQKGDVSAFEELLRKYQKPLVNFVYRFLHSREEAEEIAQEIFLRVYASAGSYRPEAKFSTWIYRIATNLCLNEIRKTKGVVLDSLETGGIDDEAMSLPDKSVPSPQELTEYSQLVEMIKKAIDRLPPRQRLAVILNKYQGLSYREIAEVMECSEGAVKSYLHRAKENLLKLCGELLK